MMNRIALPLFVVLILAVAPDFSIGTPRAKPPGKVVGSYSIKLVSNRIHCTKASIDGDCATTVAGYTEYRTELRREGEDAAIGHLNLPTLRGSYHLVIRRKKDGETAISISQTKKGESNRVLVGSLAYNQKAPLKRAVDFSGQEMEERQYDGLSVLTVE